MIGKTEAITGASVVLTADERIAELLSNMRTRRRVLLGLVEHCREPHSVSDVNAYCEYLQEGDASVYSPAALCAMLEKAGALERKGSSGEAEPEIVEIDGDEFYQPADSIAPHWQATAAGLAAVEANRPEARLERVLGDDAAYESIFLRILELCDSPDGASAQQIGAAVDDDPLLQKPRRFALYFYDKLADCACLEWKDAWVTTELGRATAGMLRQRVAAGQGTAAADLSKE